MRWDKSISERLDPSLADIDHRGRRGRQRILLPIAVTRVDLKAIVEEQGFHLLWKDIAQGRANHVLRLLPSWIEPLVMGGVVLDLGHRIVALLFRDHELPSISRRERLPFWVEDFQEIAWRGIARFKE